MFIFNIIFYIRLLLSTFLRTIDNKICVNRKDMKYDITNKYLKVEYFYNNILYRMLISNPHKRNTFKFNSVLTINNWDNKYKDYKFSKMLKTCDCINLTDIIRSYRGPYDNYHDISITPKQLGYKYIIYYNYRGKYIKHISSDDNLL